MIPKFENIELHEFWTGDNRVLSIGDNNGNAYITIILDTCVRDYAAKSYDNYKAKSATFLLDEDFKNMI